MKENEYSDTKIYEIQLKQCLQGNLYCKCLYEKRSSQINNLTYHITKPKKEREENKANKGRES